MSDRQTASPAGTSPVSGGDGPGHSHESDADATGTPLELARSYLLAVRRDEDPTDVADRLAALSERQLRVGLPDDDAKRTFWVNVYNAAVQHRLEADPDRWDRRNRFFRSPVVTVAGHELSPNDIEHGLLRRSMLSVGLGYLPRPLPDAFERTHRVKSRDPRIHFALNCGAAACPPIAAYDAAAIDDQLAVATASYLEQEVEYDPVEGVLSVPRLFLWYIGDFGGRTGTVSFCREHGVVPDTATTPSVRYQSYDWRRSLGEYRDLDA